MTRDDCCGSGCSRRRKQKHVTEGGCDVDHLKRVYRCCREYVDYVEAHGLSSPDDISPFWKDALGNVERTNYPDFDSMRHMRRGATYPLADSASRTDERQEREYAAAAFAAVSQSVSPTYLATVRESAVGDPRRFSFDGHLFSAGGLINALTSFRIVEWTKRQFPDRRSFSVLEIGAGYGHVAEQLLRRLPVQRYVVCDLPQNLFLTAFYLQANFPEKRARFLRDGASEGLESNGGLEFVVPRLLAALEGSFDLILNSYSFQEMTLASVQEYFALAKRALKPGGILYSLNAHGKSGVQWPSEYPVDGFRILALGPVRVVPHHFVFATNPYEMVLTPVDAQVPVPRQIAAPLDAFGCCFQLGLDYELRDAAARFADGTLGSAEATWLAHVAAMFRHGNPARKRREIAHAERCEVLREASLYLSGALAFAVGDFRRATLDLSWAADRLTSPYARSLGHLMLSWLDSRRGDTTGSKRLLREAVVSMPHLEDELERWSGSPTLPGALAGHLAVQQSRALASRLWRRGARLLRRPAE